ncbi:MAG: bifunctional oligoribonuclease/PAP phosphatase NrnA [Bacteroides sp.]|nr:bifunctional oligoribonuclease/PAP phosphatase NrnA [Clostridia bacterium]
MNIAEEIAGAKTVGITGHVRPDGDCVGSCMGLYNYIVDNMPEIQVSVYLEKPGDEFNYIRGTDSIKNEPDDVVHDVFFVLDCSDTDRFKPFEKCFAGSKKKICIDHHVSNAGFADKALIMPQASSTCEVLYGTLDEDKISKSVAECIYTGIIHDTGVFKYSCTSAATMTIAGKMMEKGIAYSDIIDNSFYKKSYVQNQVLGRALLESVLFYNGKCIFSAVTKKIMDFYGVDGKALGGIIEQLRLTDGVEVAIFLYETGVNEFKVSMRSKNYVDVSRIAMYFGGGGHVRAAGCTMQGTIHDIINNIGAQLEIQMGKSDL